MHSPFSSINEASSISCTATLSTMAMHKILISLLFLLLALNGLTADFESGVAGIYEAPYIPNACQLGDQLNGNLYAMLGNKLWDNGKNCGRIVNVDCTGARNEGINDPCKSLEFNFIDAFVIDRCLGCDGADLLLSQEVFSKIADVNAGSIEVSYMIVG